MTAQQIAIIRAVPIAHILAPSHVRISNGHDKTSLNELADSIKTIGLVQPILIRKTDADDGAPFVIVVGRRRLAASKLAGLDTIPAIEIDTDESKAYELEIAENIQREQMTLADTARAVRTLMLIHDNNTKKVCAILNKSPAWVSKHLTITSNTFPTTIAELLDRGIVDDLETLLLLRQIANIPASHDDALSTLTRMLRMAHAGNMNRQIARDALARLKTPRIPAAAKTITGPNTPAARQLALTDINEVDPTTHFSVQVSIKFLDKLERLGGQKWLEVQIDRADERTA